MLPVFHELAIPFVVDLLSNREGEDMAAKVPLLVVLLDQLPGRLLKPLDWSEVWKLRQHQGTDWQRMAKSQPPRY